MEAQVEVLDGLERCMTVQVAADVVDKEIQNRLVSLSRKARIDGFRPGKVPVKVVKQMYGQQVRQEVVGEMLQSSFEEAIKQESLRIAGSPRVEPVNLGEGNPLEYKATFEVFPEFEPSGIDGASISRPHAEIAESDVDQMLENLRKQKTEWNTVERASALQDQVKITFEGTIDGEPFPNNSGESVPIVLGSSSMIPGFEEHLVGVEAGAKVEFDVPFPAEYPAAELAGKEAHFNVTVDAIAEPVLPEMNDEFAQEFGIESGGLEGLRNSLRENMQREMREKVIVEVKRQVMDALVERNDFQLPQSLVSDEIENLARESQLPDLPEGGDREKFDALKTELFTENATRRVKLGLIVSRLINANDIEVDDAKMQEQLERLASTYDDKQEFIRWYRQNDQAMNGLRTLVLEDQAVNWLLEKADVVDKSMSFDELMRPAEGPQGAQ